MSAVAHGARTRRLLHDIVAGHFAFHPAGRSVRRDRPVAPVRPVRAGTAATARPRLTLVRGAAASAGHGPVRPVRPAIRGRLTH